MPRKQGLQVVRRTPPGQPDKTIGWWAVLASFGGIISLAGTLGAFYVNAVVTNARSEAEKILRAEMAQVVRDAQAREKDSVQRLYQVFPVKSEWEARRAEIDRRLLSTEQSLTNITSVQMQQVALLERIKAVQEVEARRR